MRRILKHLFEFVRLLLFGLIELDRRIFPLFGPPVRFWGKWTGKSNFVLARLLVLAGCLIGVIGITRFFYLISAGSYREEGTSIVIMLPTLLFLARLYFREIPNIERLVEEAEDEETLPRELHVNEVYWSLLRTLLVLLYPLIVWAFVEGDILLNVFTFTATLFPIVVFFVLFHYDHGGRSKLRDIVRQVIRQFSFSPIPSPAPVPSR